ncbi:hypothetical protein BKA69DRAFT_1037222 [Paraphysoderma sedebokerense]|nr:hypothetical protein BKA69DRAFT_1037222 [Paraphysoderma sedebokerense]
MFPIFTPSNIPGTESPPLTNPRLILSSLTQSATMSHTDALQSMFPSVDKDVIEAILVANNNNLESSINSLLEVSDPNYKPPSDNPNVDGNGNRNSPGRRGDGNGNGSFGNNNVGAGSLNSRDAEAERGRQFMTDEEYARSLSVDDATRRQLMIDEEIARKLAQKYEDEAVRANMQNMGLYTKKKFQDFYSKLKTKSNEELSGTRYSTLPNESGDNESLIAPSSPSIMSTNTTSDGRSATGNSLYSRRDSDDAPLERKSRHNVPKPAVMIPEEQEILKSSSEQPASPFIVGVFFT